MRICVAILSATVSLCAVEGASITPAPGFGPPNAGGGPPRGLPGQMMMQRPSMAYEVERVLLKNGDAAELAHWAELAALGYHVVSAVPASDGTTLFLERAGQPTHLQLPAAIEANPSVADALRAKIQALITERQQAMRPQQPQAPAPAAAPAQAAPAAPAPAAK